MSKWYNRREIRILTTSVDEDVTFVLKLLPVGTSNFDPPFLHIVEPLSSDDLVTETEVFVEAEPTESGQSN